MPEYISITCTVSCPPGLAATLSPVTNSVGKVTSFTIAFNQPIPTNQQYYLYYYTNALDNGDAGLYKNNVTFSYNEGADVKHSVSNTLFGGGATGQQAAVKVLKVDDNDALINGATFKLEKQNAAGDWTEVTTKAIEFGQAYFSGLLIGKYRLTETVFPTNYGIGSFESSIPGATQDGASYYFDIVQSDLSTTGKTIDVKVKNILQKASLEITKFDANDNSVPLQGAVFELVNNDDPSIKYTLTTNENGFASENQIALGTYTLKEVKAPDGYVLDTTISETYTFNAKDVVKASFTNEKRKGKLSIQKIDDRADPANLTPADLLEGVSFNIKGPNNFDQTLVTDSNGLITLTDLEQGVYTVSERKDN